MFDTKQSGFSVVVEVIVAALVIGVLCFIGWRLYDQANKHTNMTATNNASKSQKSNQNGTSPYTPTNTSPATPQSIYLDIKKWGIKFQLDDSVKDAIYSITPDGQTVSISTQSLSDKSNGSCGIGPDGTPPVMINRYSTGNYQVDNRNVFKLGSNYFIISGPQGTCSNDQIIQDLDSQQFTTFLNNFKTVQLDE